LIGAGGLCRGLIELSGLIDTRTPNDRRMRKLPA
jgi:hypothetical protein